MPLFRTVAPYDQTHRGRSARRTTRGTQPTFIPGTNAIESLNYQLRKIIKNRGHFPTDDAVIKLLWLAIRDVEDKRARQRAKEKGLPPAQRRAPAKLVEGAVVQGWRQALGALTLHYPERLNNHLT
jgi:putative transposase